MEALALASRIESVTVYREGARITRVAEVERNGAGFPATVRFGGLPLSLRDGTARVRVEADGGATPIAAELRVVLDVPERDDSLRPADDEALEAARADVLQLAELVDQIERELARLAALGISSRPKGAAGEPPVESPTSTRLALLAFREKREQTLRAELRDVRDRLEQAERRRDGLEDLDRRATSAREAREHELRKAVLVTLRDTNAEVGSVRLVLDYVVPGARWAPTYVAKLDRALSSAELGLRAVVAQKSGEDWAGVDIMLSTAEPQRWTELPELTSVRIGRRQARPPKTGWRPAPTGVGELYRDWDRSFRATFYDQRLPEKPKPRPVAEPHPQQAPLDDILAAADKLDGAYGAGAAVTRAGMASPHAHALFEQRRQEQTMFALQAEAMPAKSKGLSLGLPSFGRSSKRGAAMPPPAPSSTMTMTTMSADAVSSAAAPEPIGTRAGDDLLRYGDLRMPDARTPHRGSLVIAGRRELYLQLLVQEQFVVTFDIDEHIERANRVAVVDTSNLPFGCALAWSESYDYAYTGGAVVDIPSDGDFHSIPLAVSQAEVTPLYVVVPRESTDVFRTARLANPLDAPLLAGPVDVYWGGEFLVTSTVDFTAPRGELELRLGVEQAIKVSRNSRYREETAGLIGGSLELHHQILVDVRNNLDREAPIEVRERIPVVRDDEKDIGITVAMVSPPWEAYEQEPQESWEPELRGGHRWVLSLPAGGSQELRVDYELKISSKHELVGGNRREG